jgi:hypothetical protein
MRDPIILRSTLAGYLSTIFWSIVWAIVFFAANRYLAAMLAEASYASTHRVYFDYNHRPWYADDFLLTCVQIGYWAAATVAGIIVLFGVVGTAVYSRLEVNILTANDKGVWDKVEYSAVGFPFSKIAAKLSLNRVIKVTVQQSSIDRLIDTGSLTLTISTFANAEAEESTWTIPAIKAPYKAMNDILAGTAPHEGLEVRPKSS